jgi:hypothetical protein
MDSAITQDIRQSMKAIESFIDQIDPTDPYGEALRKAAIQARKGEDLTTLSYLLLLKTYPVDVKTFIEDERYLDKAGQTFPNVMDELIHINNPDDDRLGGRYSEVVFTGSIGSAKTYSALLTQAYQLYILSCYSDPHMVFGLDASAEILFIFQSISGMTSKNLDYGRFRSMMEHSPYFNTEFPFDKDIETELRFPSRIYVRPVGGDLGGSIGQNVFGGLIDEINFMEIIEDSRKSVDGGVYDQASVLYDSISRRRKSRFMKQGRIPGLLCLVSSKNYPGQFTDRKEEEAKKDPSIYIYDKRSWDIMPEGTFSGETFELFIGDETRQPFIITEETAGRVSAKDRASKLVIDIPSEYRIEFENDIMGALRDTAGVSTIARHPYFQNAIAINNCMDRESQIFSRPDVDFSHSQLAIYPNRIINPTEPRFVHIDLSKSGDSTGFAVGHVPGFTRVMRGGTEELAETLPRIYIDGLLRINPPKGGEINFAKIRNIIYVLTDMGMNIRWVTLDSWQSTDTIQILRGKGYVTGLLSMDRTTLPYNLTKTAIYDGRVSMPLHLTCRRELASLEIDKKKDKIDHPSNGSKDVSDALAGVISGLTLRREIWVRHNVHITPLLQQQVAAQTKKTYRQETMT